MSIAEGDIVLKIKSDIDKHINSMGKLDDKTKKTKFSFKGLASGMGAVVTKLGIIGATLTAVGYGFYKLIKPASDFIEANNRFNVVYKNIKKTATDTMNALRKEYHLSKSAAVEYLGTVGDILTGFGLSQTSALGLSDSVVRLATDLSSFANVPVKQAVDALTKSFTGERESLKSLGIVITEELVKNKEQIVQQKLLKDGFSGTEQELKRTARAYATMQLATEQSKNAVGDFNRSLGTSLPNQIKVLQTRLGDLITDLVVKLVPALTKTAEFVSRLLGSDEDKTLSTLDKLENKIKKGGKGINIYKKGVRKEIEKASAELKKLGKVESEAELQALKNQVDDLRKQKDVLEQNVKNTQVGYRGRGGELIGSNKSISLGNEIKNLELQISKTEELQEKQATFNQIIERGQGILTSKKIEKLSVVSTQQTKKVDPKTLKAKDKAAGDILSGASDRGKSKDDFRLEDLQAEQKYIDDLVAKNKRGVEALSENEKKVVFGAKEIKEGIEAEINSVKFDKFKNVFDDLANIVSSTMSSVGDIMKSHFDAELDAVERNYNIKKVFLEAETQQEVMLREFKAEQDAIDFERKYGIQEEEYLQMDEKSQKEFEERQSKFRQEELINLKAVKSRETRDKQLAKLDESRAKKEKEIKSKGFIADKAMRVSSIIMDTARAIVGFLANPGGIPGFIFSGVAGTLGAAQLGIASAEKNPYAYKEGGIALSDQYARIGEEGPEMVLPPSVTAMLNDLSKRYDREVLGEKEPIAQEVTSYDNREYSVTINKPESFDDFNRQLLEEVGENLSNVVDE